MGRYLLIRSATMLLTFVFVALLVFSLLRLLPGSAVEVLLQEYAYADSIEQLRAALGLDQPFHVQFVRWFSDILSGDLGNSLITKRPIVEEVLWRWPVTIELTVLTLIVNLAIGIPIGVWSAIRQDTMTDYIIRSLAILAIAIPTFWIAMLTVVLPAAYAGWSPAFFYVPFFEDPIKNLTIFILPSLTLGLYLQGRTVRLLRAMMLDVLRQDYVRTAWAKGLPARVVILRHALRNALLPVVTLVGLEVPFLLGGVVVVEKIYTLPGMGRYLIDSLEHRDYIAVQSLLLLMAVVVMVTNLLVDLSYGLLDPRIRVQGARR
jgi:peptide/nickel transport system permease protein